MSYWRGRGFKENISDSNYEILSQPLWINACGEDYVEHMISDYIVDRPQGRNDYQMLYIKEGNGDFLIDGKTVTVGENQIVIYRPKEPQFYRYAKDKKRWFTGFTLREAMLINFLKNTVLPIISSL